MVVGCATDPHTGEKRPLGKVIGVDRPGRAMRVTLEEAGIDVQRTSENTLSLSVPFTFDSATLTPQAQSTLNSVASVLNQHPESTVRVTGHTDDVGSDVDNQRLSEQRAATVAGYLTSNGVNTARISQQGMGEKEPKFPNTDEASRAENRRVELMITTHQHVGDQTPGRPPSESPAAPRTYPPSGSE
jgi:outer membrane protein OmpA-like peptidoglycan-associated protein